MGQIYSHIQKRRAKRHISKKNQRFMCFVFYCLPAKMNIIERDIISRRINEMCGIYSLVMKKITKINNRLVNLRTGFVQKIDRNQLTVHILLCRSTMLYRTLIYQESLEAYLSSQPVCSPFSYQSNIRVTTISQWISHWIQASPFSYQQNIQSLVTVVRYY